VIALQGAGVPWGDRRFVLDASVALEWALVRPLSVDDYAHRVLNVVDRGMLVPGIWHLEVASVLAKYESRGKLSLAEVDTFLHALGEMQISCDPLAPERAFGSILNLARKFGLTGYDASYLDLAIRSSLPLATLDEKLRKAATHAGITIFNTNS
jgi:predicted nucleic acid-binding protein